MRNALILFFILVMVSCTVNEISNEPFNDEIEFRESPWKAKLKKALKVGAADFGGGASGVATGAWWGGLLGPTGAVIGGMIGGVAGFTTGSISANNCMMINPSSSAYNPENVPFADTLTNNPYEQFGLIHNTLLNATIIKDFKSADELYDYLIDTTVVILNHYNYDLSDFPINDFKTFFKPTFLEIYSANGEFGTSFTDNVITELIASDIESDEDFEIFYNQKVSQYSNDWQKLFSLSVLHHTYYFWINKV